MANDVAPRGFLLDLDGTLYTSNGPIAGAQGTLNTLRQQGIPFRLLTNTTMRSRRELLQHLRALDFVVEPEELHTPALAAAGLLDREGHTRVAPFVGTRVLEDMGEREYVGGTSGKSATRCPDAVVLADLGDDWSAALLTEAFRYVMDGAALIALQKGRYWLGKDGLELDAGAYVVAVEYASSTTATVCGKPESPFFEAALSSLGVAADERGHIAMVGDDLWNDIQGAQRIGIRGWLVRTGKFREEALAASGIEPDRLISSVADVLD